MASYNSATGELTLWVTSQNPHVHRLLMAAFVLGMPEHKVRVISGDVGGGFGSKIFLYPEEVTVSWASKQLGRPVKWTAERRESFMTDAHGRDHITEVEMAVDRDGKIVALRVHTNANLGAYLSTFAPLIPTFLYGPLLSGAYKIPEIYCEVIGSLTNTTPVDAYRGAGRPEATYLLERMCDLTAKAIGVDVAEFRRKNLVPASEFPYQTPVAFLYDSGNYEPALDRALQMIDYRKFRADQEAARKTGRATWGSGSPPTSRPAGRPPPRWRARSAPRRASGRAPRFASPRPGRSRSSRARTPMARGTRPPSPSWRPTSCRCPSRTSRSSTATPGPFPSAWAPTAAARPPWAARPSTARSRRSRRRARRSPRTSWRPARPTSSTRRASSGCKGSPGRVKTFGEVALMAYLAHNLPKGLEPGLEATSFWDPSNFVFPFGTHIAIVEVNAATGKVKLVRYVAVDDVGNVINPMIVDGMVHGGIAQGVAQALYEYAAYDDERPAPERAA